MKKELELFNTIATELLKAEKENGVIRPIGHEVLLELLDLELDEDGISEKEFEEALTNLVLSTPRTASSQFFNQLFGGRKPKAFLGELLATMLNNSMYTYKVAGPMVLIEKVIIRKISEIIGYNEDGDGTIATGGSMTNFMGMLMARDKHDPDFINKGRQKQLVAYTSEESHYSITKNAGFCGIGRANVRYIASDQMGRMSTEALEKQVSQDILDGCVPFFVNVTSGTTVMGAFDSILEISSICRKHNIWMHVDGALGGSLIFSDKYSRLLEGVHLADSFSLNAHKMLGTPITCSIIVTKHKRCLFNTFSNQASYLYQGDGDQLNPGKISLQCGRRNDALKFWSLWKSVGTKGLGEIVDKEFLLADVARNYICKNKDYTLYSHDDSINICFNYKNISPELLCKALHENAEIVVGYGNFKDDTFMRLTTVNSQNSEQDILNFFKALENCADNL